MQFEGKSFIFPQDQQRCRYYKAKDKKELEGGKYSRKFGMYMTKN